MYISLKRLFLRMISRIMHKHKDLKYTEILSVMIYSSMQDHCIYWAWQFILHSYVNI